MLGHGHAAGGDLARGSDHFTGDNMTSTPAVGTLRATHLRVLLADEDEAALERLGDVLAELGHEVMSFAVSVQEAADLIVREDPDLAIVVVDRDDEHALALIGESVELASGPVIAQLREGDVDFVARAAERGISAYVASNDPEHVQAAIDVAVRRYRERGRGRARRPRAAAPALAASWPAPENRRVPGLGSRISPLPEVSNSADDRQGHALVCLERASVPAASRRSLVVRSGRRPDASAGARLCEAMRESERVPDG